jgi:hypothetical protein
MLVFGTPSLYPTFSRLTGKVSQNKSGIFRSVAEWIPHPTLLISNRPGAIKLYPTAGSELRVDVVDT